MRELIRREEAESGYEKVNTNSGDRADWGGDRGRFIRRRVSPTGQRQSPAEGTAESGRKRKRQATAKKQQSEQQQQAEEALRDFSGTINGIEDDSHQRARRTTFTGRFAFKRYYFE
jgi:hypothetical protein